MTSVKTVLDVFSNPAKLIDYFISFGVKLQKFSFAVGLFKNEHCGSTMISFTLDLDP